MAKKKDTVKTTSAADGGNAAAALRSYVERVERLEEEKGGLAADIREVYSEAKGNGFDPKALREIVKIRKQDDDARREHELIVATYLKALGIE